MARSKKLAVVENREPARVVELARTRMAGGRSGLPVYEVETPEPRMGAKSFLVETKGIYILERGPAVLRSLSCSYMGTGGFSVRDGVPTAGGHFDADRLDPFSKEYMLANGRRMFIMSPQIIGFWGLDAGIHHGLTVVANGGQKGGPVLVTVCWIKLKERKAELVLEE